MTATEPTHIAIDDQGRAVVAGTPFTVEQLVREKLAHDLTPESLCKRHRGQITLAQVYAALAYHFDHLDNRLAQMDRLLNVIDEHKDELRRMGVKRLGLFGSCVRNEADQASDVDVLVDFNKKTLRSYVKVKSILERIFNRKVDLVIADSLRKELREPVLKEVVYAQGF